LLTFEKNGYVGTIQFKREDKMNAMTPDMAKELYDIVNAINTDDDCRAVVLTGGTKVFCAGSDIKQLNHYPRPWDFRVRQKDYPVSIRQIRKPVIAMISGYCLGGGLEMAISADIRYASETAVFGTPEVNWGWIGAGGGSQILPRLVGTGRAAEMLLSGRQYNAQEAYEMGLVDRIIKVDQLAEVTYKLAEEISLKAPLATEVIKKAIQISMNTSLEAGLNYENELACITFATEDKKEGERSFAEKRKPNFKGC
jgi:enoyl-CoA hydratase